MSKIRDMISRGEKPHGTPHDLSEWLCESIESWSEEEKKAVRKEILQHARGPNLTPEDVNFLKECGISWVANHSV